MARWAHRSVPAKQHLDRFSYFWTSHPWPLHRYCSVIFVRRRQCARATNSSLGAPKPSLSCKQHLIPSSVVKRVIVHHRGKFHEDHWIVAEIRFVRHLGFFKKWKHLQLIGFRVWTCVVTLNFVKVSWTNARMWRFSVWEIVAVRRHGSIKNSKF